MKLKLAVIIALILIIIGAVYLSFDKIALFVLSKFYNIDVSYKEMVKDREKGYSFEDLKIMNRKMGIGFFSGRATLRRLPTSSIFKSLNFDFKFKDVHFVREKSEDRKKAYDTLEGLVAVPFEGRWTYKEISGIVEIFSNGITLKNFTADGKEIRLLVSGDLYYNNVVNADITIYFSKDVLKDIPPELHSIIMKDEPQEWKSFSVNLKGDYRTPSVQVSGKKFRLNIGTIVMN